MPVTDMVPIPEVEQMCQTHRWVESLEGWRAKMGDSHSQCLAHTRFSTVSGLIRKPVPVQVAFRVCVWWECGGTAVRGGESWEEGKCKW